MNKDLIGKKIIVFLKNKYKYEGKLLEFDNVFLTLDDIKDGVSSIAISEVQILRKANEHY